MSGIVATSSGGRGRGRGGRGGGSGRGGSSSAADDSEMNNSSSGAQGSRPAAAQPAFSARGGRGGASARLTSSAVARLASDDDALPHTHLSEGGAGAPLSTSLHRGASISSVASTASSSASGPECLLCCFPIASFCVATCQHSAQLCGTCILRVQLFVTKKPKPEDVAAASSSSAAASVASSSSADLLNEENDFKPSPAAVALAESKKHRCPFCQVEWSLVLITREYDASSSDPRLHPPPSGSFGLATDARKYPLNRWVYDSDLNIYFETEETKRKYTMMRSLYCVLCFNLADAFRPGGPAGKRFDRVQLYPSVTELEKHLKAEHKRFLCTACITTRKIFIHEQQVFTHSELLHHFAHGTNEQTITEYSPAGSFAGSIPGHAWCQFCNKPYFTTDELYVHLTTDHRSCRFCSREGSERYFRTDNALRAHFAHKHYLCEEGACRKVEANRAGFRDVLAHRAHMLSAHADTLSKEAIKKLQTIDLDMFAQRPGASAKHMAGGGGGHGHGRHHGPRPEDEFEFRAESPPRNSGPSAFAQSALATAENGAGVGTAAEDFPSLGGSSGGMSMSSMNAEARARYASTLSAPSAGSMPRSRSQPSNLAFAEDAFPSLGGGFAVHTGTAAPVPSALGGSSGINNSQNPRVRGPPPNLSEFPTLNQTLKQEAKNARKAEAKKASAAATSSAGSSASAASSNSNNASSKLAKPVPSPTPSPPLLDTRTNLSVPHALPAPVPASEVSSRNKSLVASVRAALRNDPDLFESFKTQGQRLREGQITAARYLVRFGEIFQRNPLGSQDTERMLMELIALLPDEMQRKELHQEYAKAKVLASVASVKAKAEANAAAAAEAAAATAKPAGPSAASMVASSYVAPKPKAVSSLAAIASAPSPSVSPAPSSSSAAAAPSFARAAGGASSAPAEDSFKVVDSVKGEKQARAAARRAAAAQGIEAFQGVAVRPLKRDEDDEPTDFLSAIASKAAEKERKEKAEREAQAKRDERTSAIAAAPRKGWGADGPTPAALAGPTGRAPPGMGSAPPGHTVLSRASSNTWSILSGEGGGEDDEPSQVSEPVGAAGTSGRGKAQRASAASKRTASPDSPSALPEFDPPLQSSAAAAAAVTLPEPDELITHVSRLSALRVSPAAKAPLELLALLFQHVSDLIAARYGGSPNAPANRRFHMSDQARQALTAMLKQTRWVHALEFSRATRLGLLPASAAQLSALAGMHSRYGARADSLPSDSVRSTLGSLAPGELFLLLEYFHGLLTQLLKPSHPDLKEQESLFAADEARRERQNAQFKGVKLRGESDAVASSTADDRLKWEQPARADLFERPSAASASSDSSAADGAAGGGGGGGKKKKVKQLLFKTGGL